MSDDEIKNQAINKNSDIKEINKDLYKVCKSICKIIFKNKFGTGFLIKLYKDEKEINCLMTNEHVIKKDMIESKEIIDVKYDFEDKWIKIKLDIDERFIKYDQQMDITILKIIPKDKIKDKYFLLPNINDMNYINKDIYIVQFPEFKNLSYSEGKILDTNNFEFIYDASTKPGSSGSPILLKNTTKVIGIHKKGSTSLQKNYGTLTYLFMRELQPKKENEENQNILVDNNSTELFENNEYYIGQSFNGKKQGKGIILYQNGNIKYEGYFINGEKEGKGKYVFEDGSYYIGQWLKGKKHGKGKLCYNSGKILYEGDFVNDKVEGDGRYIDENGDYYIGQFRNKNKK